MYKEAENSNISQRRNPIIEYIARNPSIDSSTGNQIHLDGTNWASNSNGLQGTFHVQYLNHVTEIDVNGGSTSICPGVLEIQRSILTMMQNLAPLDTSVTHISNTAGENTSPAMNNVQKNLD